MKPAVLFIPLKPEKELLSEVDPLPRLVGYDIIPHINKKFYHSSYLDLLQHEVMAKENCIFFYEFKATRRKIIHPLSSERRLLLLYIMENVVDSYLHGHSEVKFREGFCYLIYMPADLYHKSLINKGTTKVIL